MFSWTTTRIFSRVVGPKQHRQSSRQEGFYTRWGWTWSWTLLRWAVLSASSWKANTNKRGSGRAGDVCSSRGKGVSGLLLGNRFLDDGSSALLNDQSNYFWQIFTELCGLSLSRRKKWMYKYTKLIWSFYKTRGDARMSYLTHVRFPLPLWGIFWLSELVTLMWIGFVQILLWGPLQLLPRHAVPATFVGTSSRSGGKPMSRRCSWISCGGSRC